MDKKQAAMMARDLMDWHGLKTWAFKFDRARQRVGYCQLGRRVISLSGPYTAVNNAAEMLDTILHEIAHALAPAGVHHGPQWKAIARGIGCNGERCAGGTMVQPDMKYTGVCRSCGKTYRAQKMRRSACGKCCKGRFNPDFLIEWALTNPPRGGTLEDE